MKPKTTVGYDLRKEADGTWTVYDLVSKLPARVNGVEQVGLDMEVADDLVDLLNTEVLNRLRGTTH